MSYTAKDVQSLRQTTGAGMMDCKKALEENGGEIEAAKQWLREKGLAASAKRDDRENAQGVVAIIVEATRASIIKLKCETDFVASSDGFKAAAQRLVAVLATFRDKYSKELAELNIGGGYGIAYTKDESGISPDVVIPAIASVIKDECAKAKLALPRISIEPGRAIVGPTTTTLYLVGTTKSVKLDNGSERRYISVDGGMSENIRPALYGAVYSAFLANRTSTAKSISSRVVGKHCETGDILISEINLPSDIKAGDLLAIPATGAYGRSMASNYNHISRPAVITVINGTARVILRRENEQDLLNLDVDQPPRQIS